MIPYSKQIIEQDDIDSVIKVLKSDWLTQGPVLEQFEKKLAEKVNVKHAIAVSNGTAALHLACLVAGLKPNDIAVTSTLTFLATANAPYLCGAKTGLLDVDSDSLGLSHVDLAKFLSKYPETKVILPVHFAGLSQGMKEIKKISGDSIIIEDASHSLGGSYENGEKIGSCYFSDMTTFSFHPVKPITTAEGGAITTNNDEYASLLRSLRNHGIVRNIENFINHKKNEYGTWYYEQHYLGLNYRLSDLQAALGLTQLDKIDGFINRRREITSYYDSCLKNIEGINIHQSDVNQRSRSSMHLYTIGIDYEKFSTTRNRVMEQLKQSNILTQVHYIPVHTQPFHDTNLNSRYSCNYLNADKYYKETLSIPVHPGLKNSDLDYILENLKRILNI